ncbi:two-component regulator propeller domain-containing protein [uncultured Draconibacterium sp.]|uniref:hybrid sensor histidine kinase/response regulator transcription factor n=1 Tax=uncultured Draconibacterium sp. TaxID=1573823 RepID=UPI00321727FB
MKVSSKIVVFIILILQTFLAFANSERLKFSHYTNEDGLPSSYVKSISQDQYGFIWLATRSSVCRFDGNEFKTFQAYDGEGQAYDLWCKKFYVTGNSELIAQTTDNKYYSFDFAFERFNACKQINDLGEVYDLLPSTDGMWILSAGNLSFLNKKTSQLLDFREKIDFAILDHDSKVLNLREKDNLLVALTDQNNLLILNKETNHQRKFVLPDDLSPQNVTIFYLDSHNNVWIGAVSEGLYRINLANGSSTRFSSKQTGKNHLLHNLVHSINEDLLGRIWIGTENGLCLWSPYTESFTYYQYDLHNPQGLNTNPLYNIFRDRDGNMWLGTYFGGLNFWSNSNTFFEVWQAGTSSYHIGGNAVSCINEDKEGNIWIGMEDMGVNKINAQTGEILKFNTETGKKGLSFNNVHSLLFENDEKLWIGTYTGGINILNIKNNTFEYINRQTHPYLPSDDIYHLTKSGDSIFISTSNGVSVFNLQNRKMSSFQKDIFEGVQVEYMFEGENDIWFSSQIGVFSLSKTDHSFQKFDKFPFLKNINFVKVDSKSRVWIGDYRHGLCCYDTEHDSTRIYNEKNGFPFSWVFSMEEGDDNSVWVSGDKGLVKLIPETNEIVLYNRDSDLPFEQFNFRASYKDKNGNIYFGGNNGLISFNESKKQAQNQELNVVFRGLQLFNQELVPGPDSPLKQSLNLHPEIRLKYKQNVFTVEYSGLNFQNNGKCQYAYYLENFETNWNNVGNRDFATYTNLSPGEYIFHVKASPDKSQDGTKVNSLKIIIEPPFYMSNWGYLLYFFIFILLIVGFLVVALRIQKSNAMAAIEKREKEYAVELNKAKIEFFTNISHELRTPLTLIIGPLSKILEDGSLNLALKKKLLGVDNNLRRLLALVNQLLDFRKIEVGKESLQVTKSDIGILLTDLKESFVSTAKAKGIHFKLEADENLNELIWFDYSKVEKILVNLLSNAVKYTNKGGTVELQARVKMKKDERKAGKKKLVLVVKDDGIGIDASKVNKVFERYFQTNNDELSNTGSGIGLAFVKSLVKLHKGKITVKSEVNVGSEFEVQLPVAESDYTEQEIQADSQYLVSSIKRFDVSGSANQAPVDKYKSFENKPSVLVIDDNLELLDFLIETLHDEYHVSTAKTGEEGWDIILANSPDLIISDVMMPGISGFELTKRIKTDINTSHIPVILLTAKSGIENQFDGLKTGADVYLEKPFYPNLLKINISNILKTRQNLIERFRNDAFIPPVDITHSESDREFVENLTSLIKSNLDKPALDVTFITSELGISRSLLHLKLKKITDCSATEFVRSIRLREAVILISEGKCNISEAAYQTGFSSPAYFTRRFKEYFGKSPKEYFDL